MGQLKAILEDAQSEGSAAAERSVKLFPKNLLGEERGLGVARSLAIAARMFGAEKSFLSAINLFVTGVQSGGAISFCPPAADMTRFLDTIKETPSGDSVAGASTSLVASAASGCEESQLGAVAKEWAALEELRAGIGSDVASAMASRIGSVADKIASATKEAIAGVKEEWPTKVALRGMILKIKSSVGPDVASLGQISSALDGGPDSYAELESAQSRANKVSSEFQPDAWIKEMNGLVEPSTVAHLAISAAAALWGAFGVFVGILWIVQARGFVDVFIWLIFFGGPIGMGYLLGLRHVLAARSCTPDQQTRTLLNRLNALADGWSA